MEFWGFGAGEGLDAGEQGMEGTSLRARFKRSSVVTKVLRGERKCLRLSAVDEMPGLNRGSEEDGGWAHDSATSGVEWRL